MGVGVGMDGLVEVGVKVTVSECVLVGVEVSGV